MSNNSFAVLISGHGANLQAMINAVEKKLIPANISCVVANKEEAYGLKRAEKHGIKALCVPHQDFSDRQAFEQALIEVLDQYQPRLIALAGFMRRLTSHFVNHYQNKILNVHPARLPLYPGLNTSQRVLEAGDKEHGASIHVVTEELDAGPVIAQSRFAVTAQDTTASLDKKVQHTEHKIYPQVIAWFFENRLQLSNQGPIFDGQPLSDGGIQFDY